jgi:ABC-type phosphate transport system auxiliary subunit
MYHNPQVIAHRLERLAQLVRKQQVSDVMARTLDKLFEVEREESLRQVEQIQDDLRALESRYGMDSETFYRKYRAGETDDRMDFVEWASLVQMASNLKERLALLDVESEE